MKGSRKTKKLSSKEVETLIRNLKSFSKWLKDRGIVETIPIIKHRDFPFSSDDWLMKFDNITGVVSFNTFPRAKCSFNYYRSIVLHEFFHFAVQKIPNKDDATKIKDDFGDELMRLIDIESDFFTALFHKEKLGFSFVQYLKIYWEGSKVFKDKWIRIGKLQRYIGTLLSISKMFITHPKRGIKVSTYDLFLVTVSPLSVDENMDVLVIRREHIYFDSIGASIRDYQRIRECYSNIDDMTLKGYVTKIVAFIKHALRLEIPSSIQIEIDKIK